MKVLVLGATSAIAQAAARIWAARGDELVLVARSPEKLQAVADDLRTRGGKVETMVHDLNDPVSYPPADVVLLAHGVLHGPDVLQTNLVGPIALLEKIAEVMLPGACIAALSSVSGDRGRAKNAVYGASKAGLDAYLSALRQRLFHKGVRVVTLKPGFVDTPMTAQMQKTPLFSSPAAVGRGIVRAIDGRSDVVYLPWYWRFIMLIVRMIPEPIFKRLSF
ncbi:MAG: SDR family NAD(P)-dependent oxidoreductase [Myxococcales bacterium]